MAEGIRSWSATAASNSNADSTINWAENQLPGTVNNSARAMMAQVKRWCSDNDGSLTSGGSSGAYTLTSNTAYSALEHGLTISFKSNHLNTSAATLTLTPSGGAAFASKAIRILRPGAATLDTALIGGEIPTNHHVMLQYDSAANSSAGAWILLNPAIPGPRNELSVSDIGAVSGVSTVHAEFQVAHNAAIEGQVVRVPPGTWNLTSATTQTKYIHWVIDQGANFDLSDAQNAFSGVNAPVNYPTGDQYGTVEIISTDPANQGRTIFYQVRDDSVVASDYENQGFWVIAAQYDPLDGAIHDAVGIGGRGYCMAEGTRAYGAHIYGLIADGIENAGIIGMEIDMSVPSSATEINGYDTYQKIALALFSNGANRSTSAIEIGYGGSAWYRGIHYHVNAIDATDGSILLCDTITNWKANGDLLAGKSTSDRNDPGYEILADGSLYLSSSGTQTTILTRTGTPGAGTIGQVLFQQKNSGGTVRTFGGFSVAASNAGAGSETTVINIDGWLSGAAVTLLQMSGSLVAAGVDNAVTCGHPSFRYTTVYATTGTIDTSDEREKDNIEDLRDKELDAWGAMRPQFYQWKDAIETKGDRARIHAGWIAQRGLEAFEAQGLDPWRYAMFCRDAVTVTEKQNTPSKRTRKEILPVFNEDGTPLMEDFEERYVEQGPRGPIPKKRKSQRQVFRNMDVEEDCEDEIDVQKPTGEYRYGLRYEQCLVMETAWLRRELARVNERVTRLEHGR